MKNHVKVSYHILKVYQILKGGKMEDLITDEELGNLISAAIKIEHDGVAAYRAACHKSGKEIASAFLFAYYAKKCEVNWSKADSGSELHKIFSKMFKHLFTKDELEKLINAAKFIHQGGLTAWETACQKYGREITLALLLVELKKEGDALLAEVGKKKKASWLDVATRLRAEIEKLKSKGSTP